MAEARLETYRARPDVLSRLAAFVEGRRERREAKSALFRMIREHGAGRATGARV